MRNSAAGAELDVILLGLTFVLQATVVITSIKILSNDNEQKFLINIMQSDFIKGRKLLANKAPQYRHVKYYIPVLGPIYLQFSANT